MKLKMVVVTAVGLFLAAGIVVGDAASDLKEEMKKLDGTWQLLTCDNAGKKMKEDDLKKMKLNLADGKYKWAEGKGPVDDTNGTYKIDPSKKPKTIDAVPGDGKDKGKTFQGIYDLDGDNYKTCFALPGNDRPKEFKAKNDVILQTWKRDKK